MIEKTEYHGRIYKDCRNMSDSERANLTSRLRRYEMDNWFNLASSTERESKTGVMIELYLTPEDIVIIKTWRYSFRKRKDKLIGVFNTFEYELFSNRTPVHETMNDLIGIIDSDIDLVIRS